jgi:NTP pyrophosphatase (non-canonical NTP hydrolase)
MTDGERERLVMLAEEAAEIVQAVSKILRHGKHNYNPNDHEKITNIEHLAREIADFYAIIHAIYENEDIPLEVLYSTMEEPEKTWSRKLNYTYHQGK